MSGFDRGHFFSALAGVIVGVLLVSVVPAVAGNGDFLVLGEKNTARRLTKVTTKSGVLFRTTSLGVPAAAFSVLSGPPFSVNSDALVEDLNADMVDGFEGSDFAPAGMWCPPGETLVGFGRLGPLCSAPIGAVTIDSTGDVGKHASLVLDAAGYPVISYYDDTNDDLKLARCGDRVCGSVTVNTVDAAGLVGEYSSLVLDAAGNPVISYLGGDDLNLKVAHCIDPDCSSTPTIKTVDSTGEVGHFTSLALDASGHPVISYHDLTDSDLMVAHCIDPDCNSTPTINAVDTTGSVGTHTSLVLDAAGNPVIAHHAGDPEYDLKVAHCIDPDCSNPPTINTVDSTDDVGTYASLVLDAAGNPVISYWDSTHQHLRVAHCIDPDCSGTPTVNTVDSTDNVGTYTSLVLDAAGHPTISYYDWTNDRLKVASCGDEVCSSATVRTVDATADVGYFSSMALDPAGNPVIAYYDGTGLDLKLAALVL